MSLATTLLRNSYQMLKSSQLLKLSQISTSRSFSIKKGVCFAIDKSKLKYTEKHEWISLNGKIGTIGITDYAQVRLHFYH